MLNNKWQSVFLLFIITNFCFVNFVDCRRRSNIVLFIVDDVGRNDFSLHGSNQIPTPNIDALGYNGVIFNRHYSMHICTPSRSVLLTGNHAIRSGMQGFPLFAGEPRALPLWMPTLPEKLRELGYATHMVGKWHLGYQNRSVTPVGRGFQFHVGYWNGYCGYFDYETQDIGDIGFDLHRNFAPSFEDIGTYATDLFTDESIKIINKHDCKNPLFLYVSHLGAHTGANDTELGTPDPKAAMDKYDYIPVERRRLYADVIARLDDSVGKVVQALSKKGMLEETILVFLSDNGAPTVGIYENSGSNWPLRSIKATLFDGGIRNSGLIWSKSLLRKNVVENTLFHITDWFPTLYAAAGGRVSDLGKIDGINHWPSLTSTIDLQSLNSRPDVLLNIDDKLHFEAILSSSGRYKLTKGHYRNGTYDGYYGDSGRGSSTPEYNITSVIKSKVNIAIRKADPVSVPLSEQLITSLRAQLEIHQMDAERGNLTCDTCLFDLERDPTETTDISAQFPGIVAKLQNSLNKYRREMMPQTNKPVDPNSNPAYCFNTWFTWLDPVHKCDFVGVDLTR